MIESIDTTKVEADQVGIWFLGQASFVLKLENKVIYLDPYFSNWAEEMSKDGPVTFIRRYPSLIQPEEVTNADLVLVSHDHLDHLDKWTFPSIMKHSPQATAIMPHHSKQIAQQWGVNDRIVAIDGNETVSYGDIQVQSVKAAHAELELVDGGDRFLGFLIHYKDMTFYFAGDTVLYDGLVETLQQHDIDIAMLPINGGDYFRTNLGIVPNMNFQEAAELTVAIEANMLIPYHYDLFTCNQENPSYLVDYLYQHYPKQAYHVMALGERFIWTK
ncbi:MBL fold metallo-hydrolase [Aquibacillus sediminis]|uniref:MBL fold metallo-hydrolase n=1 Tax=Aquibacillus sediminis TaxID=2574734 RepID=UPI0011095F90|nr:MBL fold metallo-hydrolase [Aquibacillus sediminis]